MIALWLALCVAFADEYVYKSNIPGDLPQEHASRDIRRAVEAAGFKAKAGGPWNGWPEELVTAIRDGEVDLGLAEIRAVEPVVPAVGAARLPYVVDGARHAQRVVAGGLADTLDALVAPHGLRVLAAFDGTRTGLAGPAHVRGPSDLAGHTVGIVFDDPIVQPSLEALGATVVVTKTDPTISRTLEFLLETPHHLVIQLGMTRKELERTHWTQDDMRWTPVVLLANAAWYDALPAAVHEAFRDARPAAEARVGTEWPAADTRMRDSLGTRRKMAMYTPTRAERASLAAATAPVRAAFAAAHPTAAPLLTAIDAAR